jgi:hypothetical protein
MSCLTAPVRHRVNRNVANRLTAFLWVIRTCPEDRQPGDNNVSDSNLTLKQKAYHEMKEFFIIARYLWPYDLSILALATGDRQ